MEPEELAHEHPAEYAGFYDTRPARDGIAAHPTPLATSASAAAGPEVAAPATTESVLESRVAPGPGRTTSLEPGSVE
jgi:hypothetical protein